MSEPTTREAQDAPDLEPGADAQHDAALAAAVQRDGDSAEVMSAAIKALATQRRPSEREVAGLLDGLQVITALADGVEALAVAGE